MHCQPMSCFISVNAQEALPGDDFIPVTNGEDIEKVAFPSNQEPMPTYSATFGSASEVPVPAQMFNSRMGPGFLSTSPQFQSNGSVTAPLPVLTRTGSDKSSKGASLVRRESDQSTKSSSSSSSSYYYYSSDSVHSRSDSQSTLPSRGKRWVIE
jgi:hypothetical protein